MEWYLLGTYFIGLGTPITHAMIERQIQVPYVTEQLCTTALEREYARWEKAHDGDDKRGVLLTCSSVPRGAKRI